ncbi:MAG: hypothetical protein ACPGVD_07445, partial [Flavobacteriales bacterium]
MKKQILFTLITLMSFTYFSQTFEGTITYKMEALNPMPERIADSIWQKAIKKQFGENGYMLQKYFYKKGNYVSEINTGLQKGFQAFNPKDGLMYSWKKNSDTATTLNSKTYSDKVVEIIDSKETDTILGIPCKSIIIKSQLGEMILWFNSKHFKMDAKFYKGHKYGHWEEILKKTGCLP